MKKIDPITIVVIIIAVFITGYLIGLSASESTDKEDRTNTICKASENGNSKDCPNCNDNDECTEDYYDFSSQSCINKDITKPDKVTYSQDDPRDYLSKLSNGLINGDKTMVKCFFSKELTDEEISGYINLNKDFSEYLFPVSSWTPNNIISSWASDPDFEQHLVKFYMRKIDGIWRIVKIEDVDNILK